MVIDGCPPRLPLSEVDIQPDLERRRPGQSDIVTPRKEEDVCTILSGVFRIQDRKSPIPMDERIFRKPCIEVKRADEVAIGNPVWSASRNKSESGPRE